MMSKVPGSHDTTFYVQIDPTFYSYINSEGERSLSHIRAVAITQKRPSRPRAGTVMVKLTIRVPDAAFLPLRPEAIVVVPENMTMVNPIEVLANDPSEDQ